MLKPISSSNEQTVCKPVSSSIRSGIKALDITTALNMFQCQTFQQAHRCLYAVGLFSFSAFYRCKCLSAAFGKGQGAGDQLQQSFARPQPETVQRGGMGWRLVLHKWSSETMQLIGDPEKPSLSSEGPLHCWLKECCCERSGAVMPLVALCFPKPLRR